jgi:hypothetical protein
LKSLAVVNKAFYNYDLVDKLFQVMYRVSHQHIQNEDSLHQELEALLWDNFDCVKRSLVLLPKLSIHTFMKDDIKSSLNNAFMSVSRLVMLKQQERKKSKSEGAKTHAQP